jgi:ABC-2 type transport system ATP-binding protein
LGGVDWDVRPGVTGLLGPNGAGKTTLLSVIVGLLRPKAGSVAVHGHDDAAFGFVPQRFSMAGGMRLYDAISYTAWINGVHDRDAAAHKALAAVDLAAKADDRIKTLSGGQRQRAGIAAGLAHEPDVLVLDEPTVGLDAGQRWRVRDLIAEIGRTRPVIVSTHLLEDVSHMCDRVGVLAGGRLVFDGTVAELEASGGSRARRSSIEAGYEQLLETSAE